MRSIWLPPHLQQQEMRTGEVPGDVGLMPVELSATMLLSLWCCWPYEQRTCRVWSRTWCRYWSRQWNGRCAVDLWRSTTLDERCSQHRWCADIVSDFLTHWLLCWYVDTSQENPYDRLRCQFFSIAAPTDVCAASRWWPQGPAIAHPSCHMIDGRTLVERLGSGPW